MRVSILFCFVLLGLGCSVDNARNHYILAEKLWTDRNYGAAVTEFEKVISKDPHSKLGLQAHYRAATTQALFLSQYSDAIRKFRTFIEGSTDAKLIWDAQLQIGEILFAKMELYDQAIYHYQALLKERPHSPEAPELQFRIGKSQFFLFQFNEAVKTYEDLKKQFPLSKWAERAAFEIGTTYFTRGERPESSNSDRMPYKVAKEAFEKFIRLYPSSEWVPEAQFGIASCLEELDQPEEAYKAFTLLKGHYPSPHVIDVKLSRIQQRLAHKGGSVR